ncbi:unnamed protein product [Cylicocyclus nassatus]|uniref:Thioredoxin domain-containing protein n=1 Tax=Cylicocyclus nassatus TaxID=53992 RepID=A0AA36H109_CYLNA|nr:unnamed protein product [Cylicocyclus nassatus]
MRLWLLLVALYSIAYAKEEKKDAKDGAEKAENPLANGFVGDIDWVEWHKAIGVAKDLRKPIMLIIHKTWCGACKRLKSEFSTAPQTKDLVTLSKKFVMVNVQDDEEPQEHKYAPDGGYIPRVLFLDTDAEPLLTNNAKRYKNNKYFYPFVPELVDGMKRALEEFKEIEKGGRRPRLSKNAEGEQADTKPRKKAEEEDEEEDEMKYEESKTEKKKDSKKDEKKKEEKVKEEKKTEKKKSEQEKKEKEKKKEEEEEKEDEEEEEKVAKKKEDKKKEDKKKEDKKKEDKKKEDKKKEDKKKDDKKKEDKKKEDKKKDEKKKKSTKDEKGMEEAILTYL